MSRDGIVFDTALFVCMIVVLSFVTVLGSEVAEIANWQQSTIEAFEFGISAVRMLLVFAFVYRVQNLLRDLFTSLWGRREAAAINVILTGVFAYSQWGSYSQLEPTLAESILLMYFYLTVIILYNATYPLLVPYLKPRISRLIVQLNQYADINAEVSDE